MFTAISNTKAESHLVAKPGSVILNEARISLSAGICFMFVYILTGAFVGKVDYCLYTTVDNFGLQAVELINNTKILKCKNLSLIKIDYRIFQKYNKSGKKSRFLCFFNSPSRRTCSYECSEDKIS